MIDDRSAALLVRVWLEDGTDAFRARVTSLDPSQGNEPGRELTVAVASTPSDVVLAVSEWLGEFLARTARPIDGPS